MLQKMLFTVILLIGLMSCYTNRPNGWYYIADGVKDSISSKPIVTVDDFEMLTLESSINHQSGEVIYQITGKVKPQLLSHWADATEKCIGKRMGFVYCGKVISAPRFNSRIDSGAFSISTNKGYDIKKIYEELKR